MRVIDTNAETSRILIMGQRARALEKQTGKPFLMLHRGVNAVVNIDINEIAREIDFNSNDIQVYPGTPGMEKLRTAISETYFFGNIDADKVLITPGGISALDITFQNLQFDEVALPKFFWGSYAQLAQLRNRKVTTYPTLDYLIENPHLFSNQLVVVCDPGNPLGEKYLDADILKVAECLNQENVTLLIDSPYRRVFTDHSDDFYAKLSAFKNVIVIDSFSKSMGLSGQRIGFMYSANADFIREAKQRILYATNGVNAFAQELVYLLLATTQGKRVVEQFRSETKAHITKNIDFLINNNLLSTEFYRNSKPLGIFACINKTEEELLENGISAVSMSYFTLERNTYDKHSRICVSVPHRSFEKYFNRIL